MEMNSPGSISHAKLAEKFIADKERTDWHNEAVAFLRTKRDLGAATVKEWGTNSLGHKWRRTQPDRH